MRTRKGHSLFCCLIKDALKGTRYMQLIGRGGNSAVVIGLVDFRLGIKVCWPIVATVICEKAGLMLQSGLQFCFSSFQNHFSACGLDCKG